MGGSGFLLTGNVDPSLLQPRPAPRTLVDKLLFRTRMQAPREIASARSRAVDIPVPQLATLTGVFQDWLRPRLPASHPATKDIWSYLGIGVSSIYLRGDASDGAPLEWYLQFSFSGCAGQAEVSAEVAVHWTHAWLDATIQDLTRTHFLPAGFTPNPWPQPQQEKARPFLATPFGHAALVEQPTPKDQHDPSWGPRLVELDQGAMESASAQTLLQISRDEEEWARKLAAGHCLCLLCAPPPA